MLLLNPDDQKLRGEVLDLYEARESHGVVEWKLEGKGTVTVKARKELKRGGWLEGVAWLGLEGEG